MVTDQQSLVTRAYNLYKRQGYISLQMLQKELSIGYNMAVQVKRLVLERIAKDGDDE
jgi:hypothetical protein